jgi:hypothetical protein
VPVQDIAQFFVQPVIWQSPVPTHFKVQPLPLQSKVVSPVPTEVASQPPFLQLKLQSPVPLHLNIQPLSLQEYSQSWVPMQVHFLPSWQTAFLSLAMALVISPATKSAAKNTFTPIRKLFMTPSLVFCFDEDQPKNFTVFKDNEFLGCVQQQFIGRELLAG